MTIPKAIIAPANADEEFYNFRLRCCASFSAGEYTGVDEDSLWVYASSNSAAIGFGCSYPALAMIEYGPTPRLGSYTQQTDSYFFNHLRYITGLQQGAMYYYRIHTQAYRGGTICSGLFSFATLPQSSGAIPIPQGLPSHTLPYRLDMPNTRYILTKDITAANTAIIIAAHNVELDLGGHTVIYDNGRPAVNGRWWNDYAYNERASFGIRTGLWNYTNARVFNGTIRQGANGGKGYTGIGFNPLFLGNMGSHSANEAAGLTLDYYGDSTNGMVPGNGHIHHNVILDRGTVIDNRHHGIKAISMGESPANIVERNSLRRFRHQGIAGAGAKNNNELYSDSFDSNSLMIGLRNGDSAEGNRLFGMGYNPIGIDCASNIHVRGNYMDLRGTAPRRRSNEYDRLSAVTGINMTVSHKRPRIEGALFEGNTIHIKAYDGCRVARGIWASGSAGTAGILFRNNSVRMEALADTALYDNYSSLAAVEIHGMPGAPPPEQPLLFEDNALAGNVHLISLGSSYGAGHRAHFYRTRLERLPGPAFHPLRLGFWHWDTTGNILIDNIEGPGVELMRPPVYHGTDGLMEICIGSSHRLAFKDERGRPLAGANIRALADGKRPVDIRTDKHGYACFYLLAAQHIKNGRLPAKIHEYSFYTFRLGGYRDSTIAIDELPLMRELILYQAHG